MAFEIRLSVVADVDPPELAGMVAELRDELLTLDIESARLVEPPRPPGAAKIDPASAVGAWLLAVTSSLAEVGLLASVITSWLRRQRSEVSIEIDGQRFSGSVTRPQREALVAAFLARVAHQDVQASPVVIAHPLDEQIAHDLDGDDGQWGDPFPPDFPEAGIEAPIGAPDRRNDPVTTAPVLRPSDFSGEPPKRLLTGSVPARAPLGDEISLIVRVVMEDSPNRGPFGSPLAPFDIPAGGAKLTVVVESPAGLAPVGPVQQQLVVPPDGDSAPIRFAMRSAEVGLHDLRVTAWSGGTYVGELLLQVSIGRGTAVVDGGVRTGDLADLSSRQGEATLQVLVNNGQYVFQLLAGDDLFETVPGDKLTEDPTAAVQRARDALGKMSRGVRASGYTAPNAVSLMRNLGVGLWNAMIPRDLQDQFWSVRDRISMFNVASAMDTVPWEMVYPKSSTHDHGFLVEQFPVLRRMHGHRAQRIGMSDAHFVVPPGAPSNAAHEVSRIRGVLGGSTDGNAIVDLQPLLELIESGNSGLLHFACHNTFDANDGSAIGMNGGAFVPDLLNIAAEEKALRSRAPLVFLNACTSAADVPRYTGMMGFASQFMRAGAGAFVGTLWDVRSEPAGRFAEDFYARLRDVPLGEAAFASRNFLRESDGADPTWLAYTIFGDPAATRMSHAEGTL